MKTRRLILKVLSLAVLASQALAYDIPLEPDPETTPGSLCTPANHDFENYRYPEKIAYCKRDVETGLKHRIYDQYQIPKKCRKFFTIDHYIPLSMGGDNSIRNLWPEHRAVKQTRATLEYEVYVQLREGIIDQKTAIQWIVEAKHDPQVQAIDETEPCLNYSK